MDLPRQIIGFRFAIWYQAGGLELHQTKADGKTKREARLRYTGHLALSWPPAHLKPMSKGNLLSCKVVACNTIIWYY
jgi:hypothetical protein